MALVGPQLHNLQDHMENQIRTFFSGGWFPKVSSSRDGKCMYSVALLLKLVALEKKFALCVCACVCLGPLLFWIFVEVPESVLVTRRQMYV